MPRQPKLRKKKVGKSVYWYTQSGGENYFGNVTEVSHSEAQKLFVSHLKSVLNENRRRNVLTVAELMEHFLEWIEAHRSDRTYDQRRRDCNWFGNFVVGGRRIADLPADRIKAADLEAWLKHRRKKGDADQTIYHRETSIRHCWNWATKYPSPTPYLSPTYRPFAAVERTHVPQKVLTEDTLITDDEIRILFEAAQVDLDVFHRFGPKENRDVNPYRDFADMLRCYHHTGARTGELAKVEVCDLQLTTRQVVLGKHKTSRTQRQPHVRRITLNDEAMSIFERFCARKSKTDRIFTTSDGKPWATRSLPARFDRVKKVAKKMGIGEVRKHITIYDFRHLWISEALMAGNDVATVARMAGTSIAMIERVYGHFRNDHLHEAQAKLDKLRAQRRS